MLDPGCRSGSRISARPVVGPDDIQRRSLQILVSPTAIVRSWPESSTRASWPPCASKWLRASVNGSPVSSARSAITCSAKPSGVLMPVPTAVPPSGQLGDAGERRLEPLDAEPHDRGVPAELLAEHHRRRVHQVRAPGLHHVRELLGLAPPAPSRGGRARGRRSSRRRLDGGDVDRGREGVVARLAGVDVVVGVGLDAGRAWRARRAPRSCSCWSWCPSRSGRRRSGSASWCCAADDLVGAGSDRLRPARRLMMPSSALILGGRLLHPGDRHDVRRLEGGAADREVLHRPLGLGPPQGVLGHLDRRPCCRARCGSRRGVARRSWGRRYRLAQARRER